VEKAAGIKCVMPVEAGKVCGRAGSAEGTGQVKDPAPGVSPFAPETGSLTIGSSSGVPPKPELLHPTNAGNLTTNL
jgi:hypothetical protein